MTVGSNLSLQKLVSQAFFFLQKQTVAIQIVGRPLLSLLAISTTNGERKIKATCITKRKIRKIFGSC